jgi:glycogen debranching enzyme
VDGSLRPNQILAVGGLPVSLLEAVPARAVVDLVERELLTPAGLRTLARGEPGYRPRYEGDGWARDHAYHQGTVWPWLMGPFVDAWIRVRGATPEVRGEARLQFVDPLVAQLDRWGIGHLYEIADAEPPFTPRGCPFQAWSVGELIRAVAMTAG